MPFATPFKRFRFDSEKNQQNGIQEPIRELKCRNGYIIDVEEEVEIRKFVQLLFEMLTKKIVDEIFFSKKNDEPTGTERFHYLSN
jgi:hypothetical protein